MARLRERNERTQQPPREWGRPTRCYNIITTLGIPIEIIKFIHFINITIRPTTAHPLDLAFEYCETLSPLRRSTMRRPRRRHGAAVRPAPHRDRHPELMQQAVGRSRQRMAR